MQIADTVVVKPGGAAPENLCGAATKLWDKVSYILNDDQEVGCRCCSLLACLLEQYHVSASVHSSEHLLQCGVVRALIQPFQCLASAAHALRCLVFGGSLDRP
jgi:hypothetical protein